MTRLYTLPTVVGSGAVLAAACVAVVASLPNGFAQSVLGTFYWPSVDCMSAVDKGSVQNRNEACFWTMDSFWLNLESLRKALKPQGVVVSGRSVPGASNKEDGLLSFTLPNATTVYAALGSPDNHLMDENGKRIPMAAGYFSFWDLLQNASLHKGIDVSITGWDNPNVSFNDVSFHLGNESARIPGERFYSAYLSAILQRDFGEPIFDNINAWGIYALPSLETDAGARKRLSNLRNSRLLETTVTVRGATEGVYGVMTYLEPNGSLAKALISGGFPFDVFFLVQPIRLSKDGTATLELPNGSSTFIEQFGSELALNTSMLVRLAGGARSQGWYEVVSPDDITLEPTP